MAVELRKISPGASLSQLGAYLEDHLLNFVMPFWMKQIDPRGGLYTCVDDSGRLLSDDKLMWSQLRAIYTFSALYGRVRENPIFIETAAQIFEFCLKHGRDDEGRWILRVDRDGKTLVGATSIYVDGFAIIGLTEFSRVTGDERAKRIAMETFENVSARLAIPGSYQTYPYDLPQGLKAHGVSMVFSHAFFHLGKLTGDDRVRAAALDHANQVMDHFRQPSRRALVEFVKLDGSPVDSPQGRVTLPGHAIESMWFQLEQFDARGDASRVAQCVECIRWHLERGWDTDHGGGLLLAQDCEGKEPVAWDHADTKLWWPQTEALYALLLSHVISGEQWCLDWYWKVHDLCFKHYPRPQWGEWAQRLDRDFNPIDGFLVLPVKDPFHLPRSLILGVELLRRREEIIAPNAGKKAAHRSGEMAAY